MADAKGGLYSLIAAVGILVNGCSKNAPPAPAVPPVPVRPSGVDPVTRARNTFAHPENLQYTTFTSMQGDTARLICDVLKYNGTLDGQSYVEIRTKRSPPGVEITAVGNNDGKWTSKSIQIDREKIAMSVLKGHAVSTLLVHMKGETPDANVVRTVEEYNGNEMTGRILSREEKNDPEAANGVWSSVQQLRQVIASINNAQRQNQFEKSNNDYPYRRR